MEAEPRALELELEGRTVTGVRGSTVWDGRAVDRIPELPDIVVPVAAGASVTFSGDLPQDVFVTAYAESAVLDGTLAATTGGPLDSSGGQWLVDLPPGRYLVAVSRTWDDDHSVVDYFAVDVT